MQIDVLTIAAILMYVFAIITVIVFFGLRIFIPDMVCPDCGYRNTFRLQYKKKRYVCHNCGHVRQMR